MKLSTIHNKNFLGFIYFVVHQNCCGCEQITPFTAYHHTVLLTICCFVIITITTIHVYDSECKLNLYCVKHLLKNVYNSSLMNDLFILSVLVKLRT